MELKKLSESKRELMEKFKEMKYVKHSFLFGSAVDGNFTEKSDIDVLIPELLELNTYIKKFSTEKCLL